MALILLQMREAKSPEEATWLLFKALQHINEWNDLPGLLNQEIEEILLLYQRITGMDTTS